MRTRKNKNPPSGAQAKASSLKHAAALLNCPPDDLRRAKALGCPGFDDHHRVDVEAVRAWMQANKARLASAAPVSKEDAEIKRILKQIDRLELQNAILRGKYILQEKVATRLVQLAANQKAILRQKLENEYPSLVAGLDAAGCRAKGKELVDEICGHMQKLVEGWQQEEA